MLICWRSGSICAVSMRPNASILHVAMLALPVIILLEQDSPYQAHDRGFVREDSDDVSAAFDLLLYPGHHGRSLISASFDRIAARRIPPGAAFSTSSGRCPAQDGVWAGAESASLFAASGPAQCMRGAKEVERTCLDPVPGRDVVPTAPRCIDQDAVGFVGVAVRRRRRSGMSRRWSTSGGERPPTCAPTRLSPFRARGARRGERPRILERTIRDCDG